MTSSERFAAPALRMSAGVIIWALHFTAIYGYTGLACARRFEPAAELWVGSVPWVIGVATALAAVATLPFIAIPLRQRPAAFVDWMSGGLAALALFAIVLEGITFLWLPACV